VKVQRPEVDELEELELLDVLLLDEELELLDELPAVKLTLVMV
jgi:hypothetical protein